MTVKFLSIFMVTRHTISINKTKGLSYAGKTLADGRDLRLKLDYKTNKNGTSESFPPKGSKRAKSRCTAAITGVDKGKQSEET